MNWLRGFWASSKSTLRSPIKIGFCPRKRSRASSRSGMWASMVSGSYSSMTGVWEVPLTTSHLTTFGLWMRVDSRFYPVGWSHETRPTPPCAPPALAGRSFEQTMSYPRRFQQYYVVEIFVLVRIMRLKPPSLTTLTACTIPKLLPLQMLSIPMAILSGPESRRSGGGISKWSRSAPCLIGVF